MNTLDLNGFTRQWRVIGRQLPKARAFLVVSAHWFIGASAVTAMPRPRTIHDFYGFPAELYEFEYRARGAPEVAQEIADTLAPSWCGLDHDQWGLDHGTWSVLAHLRPDADIPVVQLSINALEPLEYHLALGSKLAALRDRGIVVVGSGNIVHNLRLIDRQRPDSGFDWARRFDDAVAEQLANEPGDILKLLSHADYPRAVPTTDHFIPILYIAGLAMASDEQVHAVVRGYAMGSLSMSSYEIGTSCGRLDAVGAAMLPQGIPAEQSNI